MKHTPRNYAKRSDPRSGFTVVEFVIAAFLLTAVMTLAMGTMIPTISQAREGTFHIFLIAKARAAEQTLGKVIQLGRAVSASTDRLNIVRNDLTVAAIRYVDQDGDPATVEDNILEYDPDVSNPNDEVVVCDHVTAITGEPMFSVSPSSPRTAVLTFHVGELPGPGPDPNLRFGAGYQGVEVRMAALPRNSRGMTK